MGMCPRQPLWLKSLGKKYALSTEVAVWVEPLGALKGEARNRDDTQTSELNAVEPVF